MSLAGKAGRVLARGALEVLRAPVRLDHAWHSLKRQVLAVPPRVTAQRIAQVVTGKSPMMRPLWDAEECLLVLLQMKNGVAEVSRMWSMKARKALETQGIERIVVTDYGMLRFDTQQAMLVLKVAAAGMEEGREYTLSFDRRAPQMQMVRIGPEVTVISRLAPEK